jgi:hypothetical protein
MARKNSQIGKSESGWAVYKMMAHFWHRKFPPAVYAPGEPAEDHDILEKQIPVAGLKRNLS